MQHEALTFALLRGLAMIGGFAALSVAPLRPEHRVHLVPLLVGFIIYEVAVLALLVHRPRRAQAIFLSTLGVDLGIIFVLVWFTGGGESHFYLLFSVLVVLHAYHSGPGIGVSAAVLAAGLMALANALVPPPVPWGHIAARAALFALLALSLGHIARRERLARTEAERLNVELREALTRLADARDRALRAERLAMTGQLASKVAHEVRSPLSAISLNVEMLDDIVAKCPGAGMTEGQELLKSVREEVRRLAQLTDEYLTFARLPRPRREQDSVNEMLEELLSFMRPEAERQGLALRGELSETVPLLRFDRDLLRRAVLNLVKNGMEATAPRGRVTVSTRRDGGWVEIAVADTGGGIDPRHAGHLFEPFFTTKPHGTGLGLAVARQIAEEHGGVLAVGNDAGGARFTLTLPLGGAVNGGRDDHD